MRRADKAARIASQLAGLYPDTPVPLDHTDAYSLLVAVLLSAQCTDKRVNTVTPALFEAAPDPAAMVALGPDAIREIIRPCGLSPTKAKNIAALSQLLIDRHQGHVPDDIDALEALPGVGHKTASVVVSQAFGQPAFPVDTHIHRLAWRWGLSDGSNVEQTERDLKALFPPEQWNPLHLRIIFLGREHCPARGHNAELCPICSWAGVKGRLQAEAQAGSHSGGHSLHRGKAVTSDQPR
jgi:endonuclease III